MALYVKLISISKVGDEEVQAYYNNFLGIVVPIMGIDETGRYILPIPNWCGSEDVSSWTEDLLELITVPVFCRLTTPNPKNGSKPLGVPLQVFDTDNLAVAVVSIDTPFLEQWPINNIQYFTVDSEDKVTFL